MNENEYQYVRINDGEKQNIVQCGDVLFTLSSETPEEVGVGSVYLGIDEVFLNSFCFGFHIDNKELAYPPYFSYYVSSTLLENLYIRLHKEVHVLTFARQILRRQV